MGDDEEGRGENRGGNVHCPQRFIGRPIGVGCAREVSIGVGTASTVVKKRVKVKARMKLSGTIMFALR